MKANNRGIGNFFIGFLMPTKWKILLGVLLYFSNYITFFGTIINFPIFYFYWTFKFSPFGYLVLFIAHIIYSYLLSCVIIKLLR